MSGEVAGRGSRIVTRRGLFGRVGRSVLLAAGLTFVGGTVVSSVVGAKESSDDKDSKDSKDSKSKSSSKSSSSKQTSSSAKKKKNAQATPTPTANPLQRFIVPGQDRYNCTDFTSQNEAQSVLRLDPKDPNNLDRNRDGIACGGVEAYQDGVPGGFMMPPFDINPVPRP